MVAHRTLQNAVTASSPLTSIPETINITHLLLQQQYLLTLRPVPIHPSCTSTIIMLRRVITAGPRASRALSTTVRPAITSQSRVAATASRTERRCYHEKDKWLPTSIIVLALAALMPIPPTFSLFINYPAYAKERSANVQFTPRSLFET